MHQTKSVLFITYKVARKCTYKYIFDIKRAHQTTNTVTLLTRVCIVFSGASLACGVDYMERGGEDQTLPYTVLGVRRALTCKIN